MDKQTFLNQAAALQVQYTANEQVREQLAKVDLLAIVGPTGVGKSTMTHRAGIPYVLSDVTREARQGEVNGIDYNFRADYDALLAEIQAGQFVQYVVQRNGEFYGTKATSYVAEGPCVMSVIATAVPSFKLLGFRSLRPVYIVPPSHTEWMHRISSHRDKDLESRLLEAKESMSFALTDPSYSFLLNDDLDHAVQTLHEIAHGTVDAGLSARARSVANTIYEHLQKVIK
jgi:guanylate kinase